MSIWKHFCCWFFFHFGKVKPHMCGGCVCVFFCCLLLILCLFINSYLKFCSAVNIQMCILYRETHSVDFNLRLTSNFHVLNIPINWLQSIIIKCGRVTKRKTNEKKFLSKNYSFTFICLLFTLCPFRIVFIPARLWNLLYLKFLFYFHCCPFKFLASIMFLTIKQ